MMEVLRSEGLSKNRGALVGLLNKLAIKYYDIEPMERNLAEPFEPATIKSTKIDRAWFKSQVNFYSQNI